VVRDAAGGLVLAFERIGFLAERGAVFAFISIAKLNSTGGFTNHESSITDHALRIPFHRQASAG